MAAAAMSPLSGAVAAILPHHYVARSLIARTVRSLSNAHPQTIVIIGPDHPNKGSKPFTISQSNWGWGEGIISAATGPAGVLSERSDIAINETLIAEEHSVFVPAPFLLTEFPGATFVLMTVRSDTELSTAVDMAQQLDEILGPDDLVIASVDFSHYKPYAAAEAEDARSLQVLAEGGIEQLGEVSADSRPSIAAVMEYARLRAAAQRTILDHSNSAVILGDPSAPSTTSYITMVFSKR